MKAFVSSASLLILLTLSACQNTLPAEAGPSTFLDRGDFSLNLPGGWTEEQNSSLEGPSYQYQSQKIMPDSYSCDQNVAGVMIAGSMMPMDMDFDEFALSKTVYDSNGAHLGVFGGQAEKMTLGGEPAYHYSESGVEAPCSASGYLVNAGDMIFKITYFAQPDSKAETEMNLLLNSIVW